jgi:hypothetical protein
LRDMQFLCHAKPKDAQQAAVCEKLVENTLEPPDPGRLPCPQVRTSARFSNGSCRIVRQSIESAQRENSLRSFLEMTEIEKVGFAQTGADIDPRKSALAFVFVRRLIKSSMASTVERGLKTLRNTQMRLSSSGGSSNSSLRVPER